MIVYRYVQRPKFFMFNSKYEKIGEIGSLYEIGHVTKEPFILNTYTDYRVYLYWIIPIFMTKTNQMFTFFKEGKSFAVDNKIFKEIKKRNVDFDTLFQKVDFEVLTSPLRKTMRIIRTFYYALFIPTDFVLILTVISNLQTKSIRRSDSNFIIETILVNVIFIAIYLGFKFYIDRWISNKLDIILLEKEKLNL